MSRRGVMGDLTPEEIARLVEALATVRGGNAKTYRSLADAVTPVVAAIADERAEAEAKRLRETLERVERLRNNWARLASTAMDSEAKEWTTAAAKSLHAALNPSDEGRGTA